MDLVEFIGVIKRWKWMVLAVIVVVVAYVIFSSARSQSSYEAHTTLVAGLSQITSSGSQGVNIAASGQGISATFVELVTADPVMQKALQDTKLNWSTTRLRSEVSASNTQDTPVLSITVTDTDPGRAKLLANSVSNAFVEYISNVSKTSFQDAQNEMTSQLQDVEKQINQQNSSAHVDTSMVKALQDRRDAITKDYEDLISKAADANDVSVTSSADDYQRVGMANAEKIAIALGIGLIGGIVFAFISESIRKSL